MPLSNPRTYAVPDMWNTFGHSYLQFTGGSVDQTGRLDAIFRASLDIEYTNWRNRAVSGAQLSLQGRKLGGFGRAFQEANKNTTRGAPYSGDGGALLMCYGINDLGNNGTGPSTATACITNFTNTARSVISLWRAARVFDDTDASISYGAGFTQGTGTADWSFGNSTRNATALTNANFTITLPSDYKGEVVTLCFDGLSTNGGDVTFSGTAGVTGTFSVSNINNIAFNHSKAVYRIKTLTSANAGQTIVVTVSRLDSGGSVSFDCWWIESKAPPPVIICNVARIVTAGYALYTNWTGTEAQKDAEVQSLNSALTTLVAEFDSMVQIADLDSAMNKDPLLYGDGLHPNEFGAAKCADAVATAMKRLRPTSDLGPAANFNTPSPRQGPIVIPRQGGTWFGPDHDVQGTAAALTAQQQWWYPFVVCQGRERYVRLGIPVAAAGTVSATLRWGIYDDVGWTGRPQNLVTEPSTAGAFSVPLATGLQMNPANGTGSMNITLDPGLYWLSLKGITAGTGQTFSTISGPPGYPYYFSTVLSTGLTQRTVVAYTATGQGTGALMDTVTSSITLTTASTSVPYICIQIF